MKKFTRRGLLAGGAVLGGGALSGVLPGMCGTRRPFTGSASPPPVRPSGEAAPLIHEDIGPVLARLDRWYAAHLPASEYRLNPPADNAAISAAEREIGFAMPRAWRQLYRWHNGETDDRRGHVYGLPLLPLSQVLAERRNWNRVLAYLEGNRYAVPGAGWPAGAVDPAYVNPRWIALTEDGSGNHIGLDFDPWPRGRVGQVILFGRDEEVKTVLAPSLGGFLAWIAYLLEGGNFRLDAGHGRPLLRRFRLKHPDADGFHDGARKLLGAPGQFV